MVYLLSALVRRMRRRRLVGRKRGEEMANKSRKKSKINCFFILSKTSTDNNFENQNIQRFVGLFTCRGRDESCDGRWIGGVKWIDDERLIGVS